MTYTQVVHLFSKPHGNILRNQTLIVYKSIKNYTNPPYNVCNYWDEENIRELNNMTRMFSSKKINP